MLSYKHILFATDLSKQTDQVAERAYILAQSSQAKLSVIHVIEHSPVAFGGEFTIPIDVNLEQTLEAHAREALEKLCEKYHIDEKNQYVVSGTVRVAVLDLAKELKIDLIVAGTHGHHGIDILLGSRANAILHHATCDVLVVRIRPIREQKS